MKITIKKFYPVCFDFRDYYNLTAKRLSAGTTLQEIAIYFESKK
ncbi:hypothetical protein [Candidatus Uabimicrobium sp. HlEnr_7]